jgi:ABC-2 type transport system ATP-binding protein
MNQRLGIAAALLGDPETVLFDEPINGLDPDGILWIRNLMKSLAAEGRTVFLSSHLMSEMAQTADHLLVIDRGRIIADASTEEFANRNATPSVRVRVDPLLRRHLWRVARCCPTSLKVVSSSNDRSCQSPGVAQNLPPVAPCLAPRTLWLHQRSNQQKI